jgi:hypothetical protein
MANFQVMFTHASGRAPILHEVAAHNGVHAALVAWRAAGLSTFPMITVHTADSYTFDGTTITITAREQA